MEQLKNVIPMEISEQSYNETPEEKCIRKCNEYNSGKGHINDRYDFDCDVCNNRGDICEPRQNEIFGYWYEVYITCTKCEKIRKAFKRLEDSGLKEAVHKRFDNYEATEGWQQTIKRGAIDYCKNGNGKWLFIGGQSGAGKTHLCTATTIKLLKQGFSTKYMNWLDESSVIKSAQFKDIEKYDNLLSAIKEAEVLYIDDLFKNGKDKDGIVQPPTPADIKLAMEIINYRYNNPKLYTIISSEYTLTEIVGFDEALGGRIAEMAVHKGYGFSIGKDPKKNYRLKGICEL